METTFVNQTRNPQWNRVQRIIKKVNNSATPILHLTDNMALSVILVGPRTIKTLNRTYRNIDQVTDVISFASLDSEDEESGEEETLELGDIFINTQRIVSQAKAYGHSEAREFAFLYCHGLLHCLGYDHMNPKDEKKMIAKQKEILDRIYPR